MSKLVVEEFKIKRQTRWTTINLTVLEDPTLSPKAKFIHTYLVSRPVDWKIRIKDIINRSTAGRDAIYSGLKELIDSRYIHREAIRDHLGKMKKWVYTVYIEPLPEKPDLAEPDLENPHTYYNNTVNRQHNKTLSNERVIPEATSGFNGTPLLLRIKRRKKKVDNGKLFDSSKPRRYKTTPLDSWNQHPLNKKSKYDPPVIALQSKIMRIKKPMVNETQEVIDYWNKNASQLSNNGHKLPTHRLDLDTKTSYMCKLIVTGILHTSNLTVDDIKKAIDNYTKVLENSHYYTHLYSFPQFYGKEIFSDCIEGNLSKYIRQKKKLTKDGLLEAATMEHRLVHGKKATYDEEDYYKQKIQSGAIKTEDDARRHAR